MEWTKLEPRLSKASYAQHVWSTFQAPRSFKDTGRSFTRQTCQPAQTSAFQTIMKIFQMTLHPIIHLRFVFLLFRQCSIWDKFVYAISSRLFEVCHSGSCNIFASKCVINIDILLGLFSTNHEPGIACFLSRRVPQMKISVSHSNITETLYLSVWGLNFTAKQIQDLVQLTTQHGFL